MQASEILGRGVRRTERFHLWGKKTRHMLAAQETLQQLERCPGYEPAVQLMRACRANEPEPYRQAFRLLSQPPTPGILAAVALAMGSQGAGLEVIRDQKEPLLAFLDTRRELSERDKLEILACPTMKDKLELPWLKPHTRKALARELIQDPLLNEYVERGPMDKVLQALHLETPAAIAQVLQDPWADKRALELTGGEWAEWGLKLGCHAEARDSLALERPWNLAELAETSREALQANPKRRHALKEEGWRHLAGSTGTLAQAAYLAAFLTEVDADPHGALQGALPHLSRRARTPEEKAQVRMLEGLDRYSKSTMDELATGLRQRTGKLLWILTGKFEDWTRDHFEEASATLVRAALRAVAASPKSSPAGLMDEALGQLSLRRREDYLVGCATARQAIALLADQFPECVRLLRDTDRDLDWSHPGERLTHLRVGLRYLATCPDANASDLCRLLQHTHPLVPAHEFEKGVKAGRLPDLSNRFDDLFADSFGDLIRSWGQSMEGNCASVAVIKAAMQQYGSRVFDQVEWLPGGGARVTMQDGKKQEVSADELRYAQRNSHFHGSDGQAKKLAHLCFAVMGKRALAARHEGARTYEQALATLNDGEYPRTCAEYLGLRGSMYSVRVKEIPRHQAVVAWNGQHAVFVQKGERADHYGRPVDFDGTDTNGRQLTEAIAFAPRWQAREHHKVA